MISEVTEAEQLQPPRPGLRGWRREKHRELLGDMVLWQAYQQLQTIVCYR